MSNIQSLGYATLEEFQKDFKIYRDNPNDKVFASAVTKRIFSSEPNMVSAIKNEMLSIMMETNPRQFIKMMSKEIPASSWIFIKSKDDPFFEV